MRLLGDIPNKRAVWSWAVYDLANQSFQLLINTLLFSIFVKEVIVGDAARGARVWSVMAAVSLVVIVVLSPLVGALADQKSWKRELLLASGVVCAALTASLALLGPGDVWLAAVLYVTAAVACGLGENLLGAFLPQLSTPKTVGRISAFGWTMSYVGALALLGIVALWAFVLGREGAEEARPLFVFAGVWFFAGIVPTMLFLREREVVGEPVRASTGLVFPTVAASVARLGRTVREVGRFRQLARFLAIFFVYSMGTMSVVYFLGVLGDDIGFGLGELVLFALVMSIAAGVAAGVTSQVQDRLGHRRTIRIFLGVWVVGVAALGVSQLTGAPSWAFWTISSLLGVGLGGIGTTSRAIVGAFTPPDRAAEFFGLWGMVYKLAGVCGVLLFGVLSTVLADAAVSRALAIGVVGMFFLTGFVLIGLVDEEEGVRVAGGG